MAGWGFIGLKRNRAAASSGRGNVWRFIRFDFRTHNLAAPRHGHNAFSVEGKDDRRPSVAAPSSPQRWAEGHLPRWGKMQRG
jgi:hypothetical protein